MLKIRKSLKSEAKKTKKHPPLLYVFLSCASFVTQPVHGMDGEEERFPDWPGVFATPRYGILLESHILGFLDDRSLRRAAQVGKSWRDSVGQIQFQRQTLGLPNLSEPSSLNSEAMFAEKKRLFSLILDLTESEPNEVGRAKDALLSFLNGPGSASPNKDQTPLHHQLNALLSDLDQPEALIDFEHHQSLIQASHLAQDHFALTRLRSVIKELQSLSQYDLTLFSIFSPLIHPYQLYLHRLLRADGEENRRRHLEPKVIMSGEGLIHLPAPKSLGSFKGLESLEDAERLENFRPWRNEQVQVSSPGVSSYRISQQKARALFSLNENGVMTQSNTEGSHYVTLWKGPQGGLVCKSCLGVSAGLPVGMESAMYWFSKVLFGRGMAVSSLLTFKGLKLNPKHLEDDCYYDANYHLIQVADKVEGMTLERFIENCHQDPSSYSYDQLDLTSFGEQVIISLLTNPTDGKPDNFFVTPDKKSPEKYLIIGIDNDLALKNTFNKRENKQAKSSTEKNQPVCGVNLSNILYCLPLMDKDLAQSPALLEKMSNLNEELTILNWLGLLREQEAEYSLLQQTGHLSKRQVKSIQQLNLPLKLRDDVLNLMQETLKTIKRTIKGSSGHLTCWKLFDEVNSLAKEFYHKISSTVTELSKLEGKPSPKRTSEISQKIYEELSSTRVDPEASFNILNQKNFNPVMGAYFCIHHTKTFYLETVLKADRYKRISDGRLAWESINCIPSGGADKTKTVDELCRDFLATLDLGKQQKITPFIEVGLTYFKDMLQLGMDKRERGQEQKQGQTLDQNQGQDQNYDYGFHLIPYNLHVSWKDSLLLLSLLEEKAPEEIIHCLLDWGWDAGDHPITKRNALHYGAIHNYSYKTLQKILSNASTAKGSLQEYDRDQLLNAKDQDNHTLLDWAIKNASINAFISLVYLGAQKCGVEHAYQFYRETVLQDNASRQSQELSPLQETFIQLMKRHEELNWTISWHHLCHPMIMEQSGENFKLPAWVQSQVMDHNDEFIHYIADPEKRLGNHLIARAEALCQEDLRKKKEEVRQQDNTPSPEIIPQPKTGYRQPFPLPLLTHHMYFKPYPELPGLEEAVGRLTRMILGFGAPFTELVKINGKPVMLSQGIQGRNLLDVLKNEPELLSKLDLESVSGLILIAMLTNPEDGKPDNYIVEPHPLIPGKYRLVCVDNDHAFVPAVGREIPEDSQDQQKRLVVQVKSVLYCLDQMKEEIPASIKKLFLDINPYALLKKWLSGLQTLQDDYVQKLFEGSVTRGFFTGHDNCCLKVSFPHNGIKDLFEKFLYLRDIFSLPTHKLTHIDLLETLEHFLAKRYAPVLKENISVYERFKKTDGPFYLMNVNGSFTTQTNGHQIIESQKIQAKQTLWESIMGDQTDDPTKAEQILDSLKGEKEESSLAAFFKRISLRATIPDSELQRQELFSNIDFSLYRAIPVSEQQALLNEIQKYKLLNKITFQNCYFLNNEDFLNLNLENLIELNINGCQKISNPAIIFIANKATNLSTLNLGGIVNIRDIGQVNIFGFLTELPLEFSTNLQALNLRGCHNLTRLYVKAPGLFWLDVENCSCLTDQILDGVIKHSENLKKLDFKGCPLITEWEMRRNFPNYPASYWRKKGVGIQKLVAYKWRILKFYPREIDISPQGLMAFERALKINVSLQNLTSLDLGQNEIGDGGAKALISRSLTALRELNLWGTDLGDEGVITLAKGNFAALTSLNVSFNDIGADGAKALAKANFTALRELNLGYNHIGDKGAKFLASGSLTSLTWLSLWGNNIGHAGQVALGKRYPNANIKF